MVELPSEASKTSRAGQASTAKTTVEKIKVKPQPRVARAKKVAVKKAAVKKAAVKKVAVKKVAVKKVAVKKVKPQPRVVRARKKR